MYVLSAIHTHTHTLYYRRISSIRGPATNAGGACPAALTLSGVLFPYRQEQSLLCSMAASVVAIEPKWGFSNSLSVFFWSLLSVYSRCRRFFPSQIAKEGISRANASC